MSMACPDPSLPQSIPMVITLSAALTILAILAGRHGIWICSVWRKGLRSCSHKELCRRYSLVIKKALFALLLTSPLLVSAKGMQCGPFQLEAANDGLMHINGQAPETQKMTFLKQKDDFDNVMMQWMLPDQTPVAGWALIMLSATIRQFSTSK